MSGIAETIARLSSLHQLGSGANARGTKGRLSRVHDFGSNPGQLVAKAFVPDNLAPGSALVVVLHGCTQDAAGYDRCSGWSELATDAGFAVLYPEQQRANNANLCFNWFEPADVSRGQGEVLSIRQMIATMLGLHDLDPARVFVTGLSAGGAMTSALLAAYPDVFAGGAIIAGLPHGSANGVSQALRRMRSAAPVRSATVREDMRATGYAGAWPTVSVWHGTADHTVSPTNGAAIVEQWRVIHGADAAPASSTRVDGQTRQVWRDSAGRDVVEYWSIAGMGHGTPLATCGPDACGQAGPHMIEAGISSTRHIARFWELLPAGVSARRSAAVAAPTARIAPRRRLTPAVPESEPATITDDGGPGAVIERALRAAGLMR